MGRIWQPQPLEVHRKWLETIIDEASDSLNDWENSFISDMSVILANGWTLTERQEQTLERIYADKTS